MQSEFDYDPCDMDESAPIKPIPLANFTSLSTSRARISSSRRVLMDLEDFIEQSKNKENMRMQNMRERQRNIGQDVAKQQIQRQMKIKQLQQEMKGKEMKQCTFKPKTNSNPKSQKKRDFNEFLESQNAHTKKIMEKREKLKKNIQDKNAKAMEKLNVPNKNKAKRNNKQNIAVHERLYALKDKEMTQKYDEPNNTFRPLINQRSKNIVRDGPVQELLYNEALRRQQNQAIQALNSKQVKFQKPINHANERYAAQKFIKQFFYVIKELELDLSCSSVVDYMMFDEILKNLGFVSCDDDSQTQISSNQRTLVHDAYQILEDFKVNARNICVFLLGIIGIYHINPVNFEDGQESQPSIQFNLDGQQGRKIQKHFDLFFRNRLSSEVPRRFQQQIQKFSFQPKINPLSEQMADKHRKMMLEKANSLIQVYPELAEMIPEDGVITHTDLLVLHKVANDIEKEIKKNDRQSQELKDCTFKPNTFSSSLNCSKMTDSKTGFKKSVELYQYHKQIQNKKQSLTASRQQLLDPECTFQPQTNGFKANKPSSVPMSKQTEQTLFRMHKGRQEYEKKKKFLERGQVHIKEKVKVREPILLLQVNLGEQTDKIALFEGDQEVLDQIAHEFALKHNLDEQSQLKLVQMLEGELNNLLTKVEEEENYSEEQD